MNILIDICHPAHVHLIRNVYFELTRKGHSVTVTVKDIPSAITLLKKHGIPYIHLGKKKDSLWGKAWLQLSYNLQILQIVLARNIKIGFGTSLTLAHISKLTPMHSIILDDDDDAVEPLFVKYAHPYADIVLSPACTKRATKKLMTYNGYHELSYLHPNRFTPDPEVLSEIGLSEGETYFVLRFNAFKAHHDNGVAGLSLENKRKLIAYLEQRGKVFITTERNIDPEFLKYQLPISQEKIHSLIYYATMLIGDSQTMTSEAAVLGTPAIRCNTFAGKISYLEEEEHKYQLTFAFQPDQFDAMMEKIEEILSIPDLKKVWQQRRLDMLAEKIDVSAFFAWFIENYPESKNIMQNNPEYQLRFK